jgi:threonine aldolase
MKLIDLRSDTVTQPTEEMRRAMSSAEVGDDGWGEDPTVIRLEHMAAERLGKKAALFTVSGTMSNLLAVLTHCQRGDEIIIGDESHMFHYEVGGAAALAGVHIKTVPNDVNGMLSPEDVETAIRVPDIHFPPTTLICLENTHNRCGGRVLTPEDTKKIAEVASRQQIPLYLDGARIFNAAVYLGLSVQELAVGATSVSFSLCKGLSAPAGSLLCGSADFIARARKYRQMVGGGMRQVGILAAAGIVALEKMVARLQEDHENAKLLAEGLSNMKGILINPAMVQTNIVVFEVQLMSPLELVERLAQNGVKVTLFGGKRLRMVTHYGIERKDIETVFNVCTRILINV